MSEDSPRLFIRLPGWDDSGRGFDAALTAALNDSSTASLLLPPGLAVDAAKAVVQRIQAADRPALVIDDLDLRAATQADGVHLTDPSKVHAIRAKLGDGLVLGVECVLERHACMVAAEDGADYVAVHVTADNLEAADELLSWWFEMMTTPIVALLDFAGEHPGLARHADFFSPPAA